MRFHKKSRPLLSLLCMAIVILPGCRINPRSDTDDARVRLINTVSDTSELSVMVDGQRAWKHSAFGSNTGYQPLAAGRYDVRVDAADTGINLLATPGLSFEAGKSYTLLALGLQGSAQFPSEVEVITDKPTAQIPADKARLQFINVSPGSGPSDVLFDNIVALKNIGYNKRSDPVLIDSGAYDIKVNSAESADSVVGPINMTFNAGHSYTLVLMGQPSGSHLALASYVDNP